MSVCVISPTRANNFVSKAACIINEGFVNVVIYFQEAKLYAKAAISKFELNGLKNSEQL